MYGWRLQWRGNVLNVASQPKGKARISVSKNIITTNITKARLAAKKAKATMRRNTFSDQSINKGR